MTEKHYVWLNKFNDQLDHYGVFYHKCAKHDVLIKIQANGEYSPIKYLGKILYIDDVIYQNERLFVILSGEQLYFYNCSSDFLCRNLALKIKNITCLTKLRDIYLVANSPVYRCNSKSIIGLENPVLITLPISTSN